MRTGGLLLLLSMWCGCGEARQPTLLCPDELGEPVIPPTRTAVVGQETTQTLWIPCAPVRAIVSNVNFTVRDPAGNELPFTAEPLTVDRSVFTTRISFVPNVPGDWEILAALDPGLGFVQARVIVMADRTQAVPVATATVPSAETCTTVDWAEGLLACGAGGTARIFFDGGVLAEQPNARFRAAGDVLWSWNGVSVTRWEGASRLDLTTRFISTPEPVVADRTHLELTDYDGLWEIAMTTSDGGTTLERRALLTDAGVPHEHVLAVDGGWVWPNRDDICFRAHAGPTQCARFLSFAEELIGVEADGFWVGGVKLAFVRFGPGTQPISSVVTNTPFDYSHSTPVQLFYQPGVTLNRDTLTLEQWPVFRAYRLSARYYFGLSGDQVTVFER